MSLQNSTTLTSSFKYSFLFISTLGLLCAPDRSDPNIPLGIFAFVLWNNTRFPQKHRILWVILITILSDLIWILVVSIGRWGEQLQGQQKLRVLTQVSAIGNMIWKIGIVGYAVGKVEGCKDLFTAEGISKKFLYL